MAVAKTSLSLSFTKSQRTVFAITVKMADEVKVADDRITELLNILNTGHTKSILIEQTLEVVPELCTLLSDDKHTDMTDACEELLGLLPDVCKPKELFIALLEQINRCNNDTKFKALLDPIMRTIQLMPSKKFVFLDSAADHLCTHLSSMVIPEDVSECTEMISISDDPSSERMSSAVLHFLQFLEPFVEELSLKNHDRRPSSELYDDSQKHAKNLTLCLVRTLDRPLAYLNISLDNERQTTTCFYCSRKCVQLIGRLQKDFIKMVHRTNEKLIGTQDSRRKKTEEEEDEHDDVNGEKEMNGDDDDDVSVEENEQVSEVGLSVLAYLVLGHDDYVHLVPQVYLPRYLFELNVHSVRTLLMAHHSQLIYKGIVLFDRLLKNIPVGSLDYHLMDSDEIKELIMCTINALITSKVKQVSRTAVETFKRFLRAFDKRGRSHILAFLLQSFAQNNVQAFLISLVKNEIFESCTDDVERDEANYFTGSSLVKWFNLIFKLSSTSSRKGNILEDGDTILSKLNFLRFLVIRDVDGIRNHMEKMEDGFLRPLRDEIKMTKMTLAAEIQSLLDGNVGGKARLDEECEMELSIGSQMLGNLTPSERKEALGTASCNLDLIGSVLSRN